MGGVRTNNNGFAAGDIRRRGRRLRQRSEEDMNRLDSQHHRRSSADDSADASRYARSLIEASLDPLVTISPQGKITDVNHATEQVTGISRDQLIGSDFCDYFTDPAKARQGYETVLAQGLVKDYFLTIRHLSGRTTDVLYNASVYRDEIGAVQGVFAAARDITERREAENRQAVTNVLTELLARRNSRSEYLGIAVEVIRDWSGCRCAGIRVVDNQGRLPYEACVGFDPAFQQLEGSLSIKDDSCFCIRAVTRVACERDRAVMTPAGSYCCNDTTAFASKLAPGDQCHYRGACIVRGFSSLAIVPIRYREVFMGAIHLADERGGLLPENRIEFIESLAPLIGEAIHRFNAEAELARHREHLEELVRQRTKELRQTAEDLARSNKDLEQFAYVASHDLQEPLRAVAGFVGLLRHHYGDRLDAKAIEFIQMASDGALRMQTLIEDLLTYSRVGTRGGAIKPVDSRKALENALANLQTAIEESNAVITSDELPIVSGDATQLSQLLQNLISNAIKFRGSRRPEIRISAKRTDSSMADAITEAAAPNGLIESSIASGARESWLFMVTDNGMGIEPQYYERIFLIFQRLHSRNRYPGTGIGLAVCRRIVERHGGRIWVESRPGEGSTFFFTIPDERGAAS